MGGGGSPAVTNSTTTNSLPQWVSDAGKSNYDKAVTIGQKPLNQYGGETVAPLSQGTQMANSYLTNNLNAGQADLNSASGAYKTLQDPTAMASQIQGYMNPYVDQVVNKSMGALQDQNTQSLMANQDKAVAAKAFGGTRGAIVDAVTNAQTNKASGLLASQLYGDAYDKASSTATGNITAGAAGLTNTGNSDQANMLKQYTALSGVGTQQQQQQQNVDNAAKAKFDEANNKDVTDLNLRLSALGMTPYQTQSTVNSTTTPSTSGTDWASTGLGALSLLAGFL